jgi:hypothetical protein
MEIWEDLSPLVKSVFSGKSTWSEDQVLYMNRNGYVEETYFTFSYSRSGTKRESGWAILCCIETTEKYWLLENYRKAKTTFAT